MEMRLYIRRRPIFNIFQGGGFGSLEIGIVNRDNVITRLLCVYVDIPGPAIQCIATGNETIRRGIKTILILGFMARLTMDADDLEDFKAIHVDVRQEFKVKFPKWKTNLKNQNEQILIMTPLLIESTQAYNTSEVNIM